MRKLPLLLPAALAVLALAPTARAAVASPADLGAPPAANVGERIDFAADGALRLAGTQDWLTGARLRPGDTAEYRFQVVNSGTVALNLVSATAESCGTPLQRVDDDGGDNVLEPGRMWTYRCDYVVKSDDGENGYPCVSNLAHFVMQAAGSPALERSGYATFCVERPAIEVVKSGPAQAYPGDHVTYTFTVTNSGREPLTGLTVSDDRCSPVTGPDPDVLAPDKIVAYSCDFTVPDGEPVIVNTVTASADDPTGRSVTATDTHRLTVLHQQIQLSKTGPATAVVGSRLDYVLRVGNTGTTSFPAHDVAVSDPRCAAVSGPETGTLTPGDQWIYTCSADTTGAAAGPFVNTASVTATDTNGRVATAQDSFTTDLTAPLPQPDAPAPVLPAPTTPGAPKPTPTPTPTRHKTVRAGTASLRGPSGCVSRTFAATVNGRSISRVTFANDGARVARISATEGKSSFRVKIHPSRKRGVHQVLARVEFEPASGTAARTLRLSYQACPTQAPPHFTG